MADKMNLWSDLENLPGGGYTTDEYITWTLLHYFPGPTTAIQMYRANFGEQMKQHVAEPAAKLLARNRVDNPVGVSHFPKEVCQVLLFIALVLIVVMKSKSRKSGNRS